MCSGAGGEGISDAVSVGITAKMSEGADGWRSGLLGLGHCEQLGPVVVMVCGGGCGCGDGGGSDGGGGVWGEYEREAKLSCGALA